jgi:hypothetical protein
LAENQFSLPYCPRFILSNLSAYVGNHLRQSHPMPLLLFTRVSIGLHVAKVSAAREYKRKKLPGKMPLRALPLKSAKNQSMGVKSYSARSAKPATIKESQRYF